MEHLIENLIEQLKDKREQEVKNIEMYKQSDIKELILITSGKLLELDSIIQNINEMLNYNRLIKSTKR